MIRGSCLCGGVAYEIDGRVSPIQLCHARRCRKMSASGFRAEAAVKNATTNLDREEALFAKQLTTAKELEDARREATKSKADLAAASAKLQALGVARPGASGIVQGAGTLTLTAPLEGVVIKREAVLGRFLSPQEQAFVIADPTALRATVNVSVVGPSLVIYGVRASFDI